VVLLSGGLDSATAAALARREGFALYGLTLRYGQVHAVEIEAARRVAAALGFAKHVELDIDLKGFGGSSLSATERFPPLRFLRVPVPPCPRTYVPARNTVFLSLALAWAEVLGAERIVIGVNALDYSGYPDCRPEFIAAFDYLATLATRRAWTARLRASGRRCSISARPRSSVPASSSVSTTAGRTAATTPAATAGRAGGATAVSCAPAVLRTPA
jgi:7-cyano-7-deazaguanine synthase